MTPEEFDIDFDFDKEYGYMNNAGKNSAADDDFDLEAALARELGPDFDELFEKEYAASQAALNSAAAPEPAPVEAPAEDDLDQTRLFSSFAPFMDTVDDEEDEEEPAPEAPAEEEPAEEPAPAPERAVIDDSAWEDLSSLLEEADADIPEAPLPEEEIPEEDYSPARRERRPAKPGFDMGAITEKIDLNAIGEKINLKAIGEKIDFQAMGEKCAAAGAVIAAGTANFFDALKECKPGKMDKKQKRRFKNDVLPVLIGGAAFLLCMIFIIGSIGRAIGSEERQQAALMESIAQAEREEAAAAEIRGILDTAAAQAAGYNYQAAIDTLDSYKTADRELTDEMAAARAQYTAAMTDLVVWDDPAAIPNLSFHVLIEDTARAYADEGYANSYRTKFITTAQFSQILEQLHENGFVLVNLESCITENTDANGVTTYTTKPIYLPSDKTPIMITETLVNYFEYMTGDGFASKLVISGGEIKAEYTDAEGQTHVGDYDLVPILNTFIDAHPDFSYRGAKAILAVTGSEGVFGWRTNTDAALTDSVKDIVEVLRADGYQIACNSFANLDYSGRTSIAQINADIDQWDEAITPILGEVDIMVIAKGSAIKTRGGGFEAMEDAGFHYIIDCTGTAGGELTSEYFHQHRIMVTGENLGTDLYSAYFTLTE